MPKHPLLKLLKIIGSLDENTSLEEYYYKKNSTRRDFIKKSAALTAAGLSLTGFTKKNQTSSAPDALREPVVILGAGISGLTSAYRLLQKKIPVVLYEANQRAGGRVHTKYDFNQKGLFCELGGELIDTGHEDLLNLAKDLGLEIQDLNPYDNGFDHFNFFVSGKYYTTAQFDKAIRPLYKRLRHDLKKCFKDLDNRFVGYKNYSPAALKFDRMPLSAYFNELKKYVEPWIIKVLDAAYVSEYGLDADVQSTLNFLILVGVPKTDHGTEEALVFGESDESLRIKGGNSKLTEALVAKIKDSSEIHLGHELVKISNDNSSVKLVFKTPSGTQTIQAKQVICTIPFSTLRDVEGLDHLGLSPVKLDTIKNLSYGTHLKRMMGFNSRPWRTGSLDGVQKGTKYTGYSFTDLPFQSCWETSRGQALNSDPGIITNLMGGRIGLDPNVINGRDECVNQFNKVLLGTKQYFTGEWVSMPWAKMAYFKGSYACPTVGQYTTMMGSPGEPELGGQLLFAGEHASDGYQGYINGAVESAEIAVKKIK